MKSFLYLHTSDLPAARHFYSNLVGLTEIYFSTEEESVGYQVGSLQLTIGRHEQAQEVTGWASQLGWSGGTSANPSWGFHLEAEEFRRTVQRLTEDGVDARNQEPDWVGYWSFPVRDPMGNTVEITTTDQGAWPAV